MTSAEFRDEPRMSCGASAVSQIVIPFGRRCYGRFGSETKKINVTFQRGLGVKQLPADSVATVNVAHSLNN